MLYFTGNALFIARLPVLGFGFPTLHNIEVYYEVKDTDAPEGVITRMVSFQLVGNVWTPRRGQIGAKRLKP